MLNSVAGQLTLWWREESWTRSVSRRDDKLFSWSSNIQTGCRSLLFWKAFHLKAAVSDFIRPGWTLASPSRGLPHPHADVPQGLLHHTSFKESRPRSWSWTGPRSALAGNGGQGTPPCSRQHPQQHAGMKSRTKPPSLLSAKSAPSTCPCSAVFSPAGQPLPGRLVPTSRRNEARGSHATALPAGLPAPRTGVPTPRSGLPERSAR